MGLRSTWDYAVHATTRYRMLRSTCEDSTWNYAAPGTTQYTAVLEPCLDLLPRPVRQRLNSEVSVESYFVLFSLVCLFVSPGSGRAVRK